ncbi:MAG: hypothetical protein ACLQVN_12695 [Bryobacteraceae bacterium]
MKLLRIKAGSRAAAAAGRCARRSGNRVLPTILRLATSAMLARASAYPQELDVRSIVARSVVANDKDWAAAPRYDFTERDRAAGGTKTYRVMMILGSPYYRLIAVNGKPLPAPQSSLERQRLENTIAQRREESPQETAV